MLNQKGRDRSDINVENVSIPLTASVSQSIKSQKKGEIAAVGITDSTRITFLVTVSTLKSKEMRATAEIPKTSPTTSLKTVPATIVFMCAFLIIREKESPTVKSIAGIVIAAKDSMLLLSQIGTFIPLKFM